MRTYEDASESDKRINHIIHEVEDCYFYGRNVELKFFHEFIQLENPLYKIIHLYGEAGIGKTFLLNGFARLAANENIPFIHLDTQDFDHSIQGFLDYFHTMISTKFNKNSSTSLKDSLQLINHFGHKIIIALDTYEQMKNLDRWFRNVFIRQLHPNVCIILAGRKQLVGEWQESPAWRKVTKQINISSFGYDDTYHFLIKNGITDEITIKKIWEFTKGHPLLLSLALKSDFPKEQDIHIFQNNSEILSILTSRWLSEVKDEDLINIIEVAALFYYFDQNKLTQVLNQKISIQTFHELTSLSFILKTNGGWQIQELVRDAIRVDLKQRNLARYELLTKKIIQYYYECIIIHQSKEDVAAFFYHIGDDIIQSVFFQDVPFDSSMYLEPIGDYNFHEVEEFFTYVKENISKSKTSFYNRFTNLTYQFDASIEHNILEHELIGPTYIKKMGYHGANLLRKKNGELIGITINVPINEKTLPLLANEPVSRAYFANLSDKEKQYFNVPVEKTAGYFLRYQEYKDPSDKAARAFLLYSLFPLIFSGGKLIASTPLKLYQDLLYKFGFQTVAGAEHDDYLGQELTPTFLLDLSGPKLIPYLKNFIAGITPQDKLDILTQEFSLTARETDILRLLLEDKTIIEISRELFIAEITVKKALSRVYQKANVKNRVQLMKRVMDIF